MAQCCLNHETTSFSLTRHHLRLAKGDPVDRLGEELGLPHGPGSGFAQGQRTTWVDGGHLEAGFVSGQLAELQGPRGPAATRAEQHGHLRVEACVQVGKMVQTVLKTANDGDLLRHSYRTYT